MSAIEIVSAETPDQLALARELFLEYGRSISFHPCIEGFQKEVNELPGCYAPPTGRLLLAVAGESIAGCVALRNVSEGMGEIKRLYVQPSARGHGTGRRLVQAVIDAARQIGYHTLRLDTLPEMSAAHALYRSLGFKVAARARPFGSSGEPIDMEMSLR